MDRLYDAIFVIACVAIAGWAFLREQKQKRREAHAAHEHWLAVRQAYIAGIKQAEGIVRTTNEAASQLIGDEIKKQERLLATENLKQKPLAKYL